ncbi:hypothetical protein ADEAN_000688700 [Angomonas deanei]|uniref:Uncharacterized protein n=1 Tax=Angomonas deanei TaxID=59799 RepID=A0A7G2CM90_9TRYP|nr:hypothetical protein ADEAN_000688700 [Angomonas deanei]
MSSLEKCADSLLEQKTIQLTTHELLEKQVQELERTKRSLGFNVKRTVGDVQRRVQDIAELQNGIEHLNQQLSEGKLKVSALDMQHTQTKKHNERILSSLSQTATEWHNFPETVAKVFSCLRERKLLLQCSTEMKSLLTSCYPAVQQIYSIQLFRQRALGRVELQSSHRVLFRSKLEESRMALHDRLITTQEAIGALRVSQDALTTAHSEITTNVNATQVELAYRTVHVEAYRERVALLSQGVLQVTETIEQESALLEELQVSQKAKTEEMAAASSEKRRLEQQLEEMRESFNEEQSTKEEKHRTLTKDITDGKHRFVSLSGEHSQVQSENRVQVSAACRTAYAKYILTKLHGQKLTLAEKQQRERSSREAELNALRQRHDQHVKAQAKDRFEQRCAEAVAALSVEESLSRRRLHQSESGAFTALSEAFQEKAKALPKHKKVTKKRPRSATSRPAGEELGIFKSSHSQRSTSGNPPPRRSLRKMIPSVVKPAVAKEHTSDSSTDSVEAAVTRTRPQKKLDTRSNSFPDDILSSMSPSPQPRQPFMSQNSQKFVHKFPPLPPKKGPHLVSSQQSEASALSSALDTLKRVRPQERNAARESGTLSGLKTKRKVYPSSKTVKFSHNEGEDIFADIFS